MANKYKIGWEKKMKRLLRMNLQLLASDTGEEGGGGIESTGAESSNSETTNIDEIKTEEKSEVENEKKYTDEDLDALIEKKFSKWKKAEEKRVSEATKLAEMNAQQRAEYERDQYKQEIEQLRAESEKSKMESAALEMLSEQGINVNQKLVSTLVSKNAEATKESVGAFIEAFNEAVESAVNDRIKSTSPKKFGGGSALTKEEIFKIENKSERQRAIAENIHLFEGE